MRLSYPLIVDDYLLKGEDNGYLGTTSAVPLLQFTSKVALPTVKASENETPQMKVSIVKERRKWLYSERVE
jgi:hypothetical protein